MVKQPTVIRYPVIRADLNKRTRQPFINRLIAVILFKLYYLSVWFNKKMTKQVTKPRLGRL